MSTKKTNQPSRDGLLLVIMLPGPEWCYIYMLLAVTKICWLLLQTQANTDSLSLSQFYHYIPHPKNFWLAFLLSLPSMTYVHMCSVSYVRVCYIVTVISLSDIALFKIVPHSMVSYIIQYPDNRNRTRPKGLLDPKVHCWLCRCKSRNTPDYQNKDFERYTDNINIYVGGTYNSIITFHYFTILCNDS